MEDVKFTKDGVEFFNNYFYLTETEANVLQLFICLKLMTMMM